MVNRPGSHIKHELSLLGLLGLLINCSEGTASRQKSRVIDLIFGATSDVIQTWHTEKGLRGKGASSSKGQVIASALVAVDFSCP